MFLEGKYKNKKIINSGDMLICDGGLTPRYISSYTVIDESNKDQYSFCKGALGVALFGGFGAIAVWVVRRVRNISLLLNGRMARRVYFLWMKMRIRYLLKVCFKVTMVILGKYGV